jgi:hypothetical protein
VIFAVPLTACPGGNCVCPSGSSSSIIRLLLFRSKGLTLCKLPSPHSNSPYSDRWYRLFPMCRPLRFHPKASSRASRPILRGMPVRSNRLCCPTIRQSPLKAGIRSPYSSRSVTLLSCLFSACLDAFTLLPSPVHQHCRERRVLYVAALRNGFRSIHIYLDRPLITSSAFLLSSLLRILFSGGGCRYPLEEASLGRDCTEIPHVRSARPALTLSLPPFTELTQLFIDSFYSQTDAVSCVASRCVISSCARGFSLSADGSECI